MSDDGPRPRKKRRWRRWLAVICVILAVGVFFLFRDEELKPADDLMPQRPEAVWDDSNGWKRLNDFAEKITPLDKKTQGLKLTRILSLEEEAEEAEWKAVELTEAELKELESIAALPVFQDVRYENLAAMKKGDQTKSIPVARRLQATVVSAIENAQQANALRCLHLAAELKRRLMTGATSDFGYIVGQTWLGDDAVMYALTRGEWSEADLKDLAAIMQGDAVNPGERQSVMRYEFAAARATVLESPGLPAAENRIERIYYQKNATANLLADQAREALGFTLTAPWMEVLKSTEKKGDDDWTTWLDPNRSGKWYLNAHFAGSRMEEKWRGNIGIRRCLQVVIALHRFQKARGSLPVKPEHLIPDFLPSVPAGPYYFEPFHWNAKNRAVQFRGSDYGLAKTEENPKSLIDSKDRRFTVYFRTKAEDAARRASLPIPAAVRASKSKTPAKLSPPGPAADGTPDK